MSMGTFLQIVLRSWKIILVAVIVTTVTAGVFAARQKPVYQASSTVELKASNKLETPQTIIAVFNTLDNRSLITTVARKVGSRSMEDAIAKKLNVQPSDINDSQLEGVVVPQSNLIEIRAQSTDPTFAAAIANSAAQELVDQGYQGVLEVEVLDSAMAPEHPVQNGPISLIPLAIITGLVLGIVLALLAHALNQIRFRNEVEAVG